MPKNDFSTIILVWVRTMWTACWGEKFTLLPIFFFISYNHCMFGIYQEGLIKWHVFHQVRSTCRMYLGWLLGKNQNMPQLNLQHAGWQVSMRRIFSSCRWTGMLNFTQSNMQHNMYVVYVSMQHIVFVSMQWLLFRLTLDLKTLIGVWQ